MRKTTVYFLVAVAGLLGVSLWSTWLVTHPVRIESGYEPRSYGMLFEEVSLAAEDGTSISGWFIPAPGAITKPALLILHGYPAEKGDMLSIARELHEDFNILLIDFRYFGGSSGSSTALGTKEPMDIKAAMDFLEARGFQKAGVIGFSFGGSAAIVQASQDTRVSAVVSYAAFADLTRLGRDAYAHLPVIREILVLLMKFWARVVWDIDASFSPEIAARRLMIPVLLIHSESDEQVPFHHALILQEALRGNDRAEFYFMPDAIHGELPPGFGTRVKDFFSRYRAFQ